MATQLAKIEQLSHLVIRVLGCNPGMMTLQGTNTYIIGNGPKRILLDTGEANNEEYISTLKNVLEKRNISLKTILISHWHHDHTGGIPGVLKLCDDSNVKVMKIRDAIKDNFQYSYLENQEEIKVDGASLKIIHTPGHSEDHMIVKLIEENSIFSGDCILGEGTAVFEDLYEYMKSLQTILDLAPKVIYPGHGPIIEDPVEKITFYITHRNQREEQILNVFKANPNKTFEASELVKIVYADTPEHLHPVATINLIHHIKKLVKEGKLMGDDCNDEWMLVRNKL